MKGHSKQDDTKRKNVAFKSLINHGQLEDDNHGDNVLDKQNCALLTKKMAN